MQLPYPGTPAVPLVLAPMAGVSESPFRQICRRFGADVVRMDAAAVVACVTPTIVSEAPAPLASAVVSFRFRAE